MFGIGPEQRWQLLVIQESEKHVFDSEDSLEFLN